jgi:hypothetical protein
VLDFKCTAHWMFVVLYNWLELKDEVACFSWMAVGYNKVAVMSHDDILLKSRRSLARTTGRQRGYAVSKGLRSLVFLGIEAL